MSEEFRGRQLFTTGTTLAELQSRLDAGAVVKKTTLTDVFDLAAFRRTHPEAIPMFLLAPHGDLLVVTEDITAPPRAGYTVIKLAEPGRSSVTDGSTAEATPVLVA